MNDDGLGDWRHWAVSRISEDVPAAYPGGPSHKAGTPIFQLAVTRDRTGQVIGFTMPSPTALALSIAIQSAKKADILRGEITFQRQTSPFSANAIGVPSDQAVRLYDFFEQCMIAATFSFNALEVFCNQTVANELNGRYLRTRGKRKRELTAEEVQRQISTEEKLTEVLPSILDTSSPLGEAVWGDYRVLNRVRNSTIHLKAADAYSARNIDRQSLFYEFFSMESVMSYPILSIELIRFFSKSEEREPRWLRHAKDLAEHLRAAKKP